MPESAVGSAQTGQRSAVKRGKLAVHKVQSKLSPLGAAQRRQSCGNRVAAQLRALIASLLNAFAVIDKPGPFRQDSRLPAFYRVRHAEPCQPSRPATWASQGIRNCPCKLPLFSHISTDFALLLSNLLKLNRILNKLSAIGSQQCPSSI